MKLSFIGYGSMTKALAPKLARKHDVLIGGRDTSKAADVAGEIGVAHGSSEDAADHGEVVVLAVAATAALPVAESLAGRLAGKTVVDINNLVRAPGGFGDDLDVAADFIPHQPGGMSLSERLAEALPDAGVAKAFNTAQAKVWAMDPVAADGRTFAVPYCGNSVEARGHAATLLRDVGCEPVDFGDLVYARLLENLGAATIKLLFEDRDPRTFFQIIQPEVKPL